ncbi:MAG: hypothetical protein WB949_07300, partial [Candidatus Acidiferrales bacterium]
LTLEQVREALAVFAKQKHLAAIEVTAYNPTKDPDGSGAKLVIDLLADVLGERLETLKAAAPPVEATAPAAPSTAPAPPSDLTASIPDASVPAAAPGEAWSSDMLESESGSAEAAADAPDDESSEASTGASGESSDESDDSHSQ